MPRAPHLNASGHTLASPTAPSPSVGSTSKPESPLDGRATTPFESESEPGPDLDFEGFAAEVRRDLAPTTRLECVLVDRVVLAAWRLHRLSIGEYGVFRSGEGDECADRVRLRTGRHRAVTREALRAESSLETAMSLLAAARIGSASTKPRTDVGDFADLDDVANYSNEWPVVAPSETIGSPSDAATAPGWAARLVMDESVSCSSPVVRGTWVTVRQIVSLVVDGWSWTDILRSHPELSEDDIRACLAYTVEHDAYDEP